MAYDCLHERTARADREYLLLLELAAKEGEERVDRALLDAFDRGEPIAFETIESHVASSDEPSVVRDVQIDPVDLAQYDELFAETEVLL